ncbi:hypothetical protein [Planomonospora sphaerica]|nr:hypothetical protein [Planomonospora sphaerica]
MAKLRITRHSEEIVTTWKAGATPEDRRCLEELIEAIENRCAMQGKFPWKKDGTDPEITVFEPRKGLWVAVRMWTDDPPENPDQFDVVTIKDIRNPRRRRP